jgi:hypothetical protein
MVVCFNFPPVQRLWIFGTGCTSVSLNAAQCDELKTVPISLKSKYAVCSFVLMGKYWADYDTGEVKCCLYLVQVQDGLSICLLEGSTGRPNDILLQILLILAACTLKFIFFQ